MNLEELMLEDVQSYCSLITKSNVNQKVDGAKAMVVRYNNIGLTKEEIIRVLNKFIIQDEPEEHQELVITEVINCILGNTSTKNILKLK